MKVREIVGPKTANGLTISSGQQSGATRLSLRSVAFLVAAITVGVTIFFGSRYLALGHLTAEAPVTVLGTDNRPTYHGVRYGYTVGSLQYVGEAGFRSQADEDAALNYGHIAKVCYNPVNPSQSAAAAADFRCGDLVGRVYGSPSSSSFFAVIGIVAAAILLVAIRVKSRLAN